MEGSLAIEHPPGFGQMNEDLLGSSSLALSEDAYYCGKLPQVARRASISLITVRCAMQKSWCRVSRLLGQNASISCWVTQPTAQEVGPYGFKERITSTREVL